MATKKAAPKTPTTTPTGAGAQPPATTDLLTGSQNYANSSTGAATGTAAASTAGAPEPYQELPWTGPDVPLPGDTITTGSSGSKGKKSTPADIREAALAGLAKYFGITTPPPGQTLEELVTSALASKYHLLGGTPAGEEVKTTKTKTAPGGTPGRGGGITRPDLTETSTSVIGTPPEPSKNALHDIAVRLGLDQNTDPLVAIAGKLGIHNPADNTLINGGAGTTATAGTTASQYAQFVGEAFDKKGNITKLGQQIAANLGAWGYLDVSTSASPPTANDIQKAYQAYLSAAAFGVKTGDPNTSLPPGQGLKAAAAYGEKQVLNVQGKVGSSEPNTYVQGVAAEFGVYVSPMQVNGIVNDPKIASVITSTGSIANAADQVKAAVIKLYDPNNPNDPAGVANSMFTGIQQAALKYQLPLSTDQINMMVQNGLQTASVAYPASAVNDVVSKATEQFQQQAEGLYPSLAAQIKAGNDVMTLTAPYFNVAEAVTGVPASSMMADNAKGGTSKWSAFMQGGTAQPGGTKTSGTAAATEGGNQTMTLDEWKKYLMANPQYGFSKTQGGRDMGEQMASAILNEFGKVNTEGGTSTPFGAFSPSSDFAVNTGSG